MSDDAPRSRGLVVRDANERNPDRSGSADVSVDRRSAVVVIATLVIAALVCHCDRRPVSTSRPVDAHVTASPVPDACAADRQLARDGWDALLQTREADFIASWAAIPSIARAYRDLGVRTLAVASRLAPAFVERSSASDSDIERASIATRIHRSVTLLDTQIPLLESALAGPRDMNHVDLLLEAGEQVLAASERIALATIEAALAGRRPVAGSPRADVAALAAMQGEGSALDDRYTAARDHLRETERPWRTLRPFARASERRWRVFALEPSGPADGGLDAPHAAAVRALYCEPTRAAPEGTYVASADQCSEAERNARDAWQQYLIEVDAPVAGAWEQVLSAATEYQRLSERMLATPSGVSAAALAPAVVTRVRDEVVAVRAAAQRLEPAFEHSPFDIATADAEGPLVTTACQRLGAAWADLSRAIAGATWSEAARNEWLELESQQRALDTGLRDAGMARLAAIVRRETAIGGSRSDGRGWMRIAAFGDDVSIAWARERRNAQLAVDCREPP